ncbi:MAG: hypothetical protein M1510_07070 [Nitrospirae bacterium]|nr:hypothetical protein [Nitrospirota bacterium]MCL5236439.1 hypothetical protein [Nitrospirota bacterium]
MEGVKIYGLCLERLRYQINNAKNRIKDKTWRYDDRVLLECYNTGEPDDIIDILELYDVEENTYEQVREKLEDLAYTVSALTREILLFDYTHEGHLGLYLVLKGEGINSLRVPVCKNSAESTYG